VGNYHPILMQIGTQTEKNMLSSKFIIPEVTIKFQDDRRRHFGNSSACNKMGNYNPIFMQIAIQTIRKACRVQKLQNQRRSPSFKMTTAALLFIEMNAIKWAITTRF
jgi:hypothetical protein